MLSEDHSHLSVCLHLSAVAVEGYRDDCELELVPSSIFKTGLGFSNANACRVLKLGARFLSVCLIANDGPW